MMMTLATKCGQGATRTDYELVDRQTYSHRVSERAEGLIMEWIGLKKKKKVLARYYLRLFVGRVLSSLSRSTNIPL